jgi:DNA processing protein
MSAGQRATGIRLSDDQRLAWLRLIRSENIGPVTFRELINHFGSGGAALAAAPDLARRGGRSIRICSEAEAARELAALDRLGGRMVAMGEPDYPAALRHLADAPPLLSVIGGMSALRRPMVAIVGSRNSSVAGRKFAAIVARGLGEAGYVVTSGLARGIDGAAHESAISTGTVAVLAGGLDHIYPPEHAGLAERIAAEDGALLTEMPVGHEPRGRDFPRRNRIISGVSLAVVVVEAAERSGSLITARRAAEQGRLVFAAPGSPLDPRAAGSNRLIKEGAHIATSPEDIIAEIDPMLERQGHDQAEEPAEEPMPADDVSDDERERVIAALGPTPVEIDEIIRFTGARPAVVHLVLLELALAGRLERHGGQRVSMV